MLPLTAPQMVKCEQMGWVRSGEGVTIRAIFPSMKLLFFFVIWISQTSPGAAKGTKSTLPSTWVSALPSPARPVIVIPSKRGEVFLLTCQLSCKP